MKTTYTIALSLALVAGLCSCQKEEKEMPQPSGVPMTLHASFAAETKATATPLETGGLKTTWNAGDKISVLTLDASGNLKYNDVFTLTTGAGTTNADFAGTYTGGSVADAQVVCYYPALAYSNKEGQFMVSEVSQLLMATIDVNNGYYNFDKHAIIGNKNTENVTSSLIMSGNATITDGVLTTTLNNRIAVLKIIVREANSKFSTATKVSIESTNKVFDTDNGTCYYYLHQTSGFLSNNTFGYMSYSYNKSLIVNSITGDLILYLPVVLNPATAGEVWTVALTGQDASSEATITLRATKTFSKAFTFEPGVCYPITFDAAEFVE